MHTDRSTRVLCHGHHRSAMRLAAKATARSCFDVRSGTSTIRSTSPRRQPTRRSGEGLGEQWRRFEQLSSDGCGLRKRYWPPLRSGWWNGQVQVESLAALAASLEHYDSDECDDPPGKVSPLYDLERVAQLLKDGAEPFHPDRDRLAFARYQIDLGCQPHRTMRRHVPDTEREGTCGAALGGPSRWRAAATPGPPAAQGERFERARRTSPGMAVHRR
jgi:hypothetical protein